MDTRTLEYFLKIAEYQSITKAAADLHIAQPYLTRQLQSLEAEVGVPLFIREKKRLHITEEGRLFQEGIFRLFGFFLNFSDVHCFSLFSLFF